MKKIMFLMLMCFALLLTSCNDADETEKMQETLSDSINEEVALEFLKDGRSLESFDSHTEVTVYTLGYYGSPSRYALLDVDSDGADEMVIEYDYTGDTHILDIKGGVCTSYYVPYRGITELKKDGTMSWSASAFENGVRKISFTSDGIVVEDIIMRNTEQGIFMVNGKNVTEEEYADAQRLQDEKEGVEWISVNQEFKPDFLAEFKNKAEGVWTKDYDEFMKEFVSFNNGNMSVGTLSGHSRPIGEVIFVRKIGIDDVYEIDVHSEEVDSYYRISFYDNKLKMEYLNSQDYLCEEYEYLED